MKLKLYFLFTFFLLISSFLSRAQEVNDPQLEFVDNTWYLTKLVIDGTISPFVSSNEVNEAIMEVDSSDTSVVFISFCDLGAGMNLTFEDDSHFTLSTISFLAGGFHCQNSANIAYHNLYFNDFWYNNTSINPSFYFPFVILEMNGYKKLIITNTNGDQAFYQSIPTLSVLQPSHIKLSIYPNPTNGFINIENISPPAIFQLYDINGKRLWDQKLKKPTTTINLNRFKAGLYFYMIQKHDKVVQQGKIINK